MTKKKEDVSLALARARVEIARRDIVMKEAIDAARQRAESPCPGCGKPVPGAERYAFGIIEGLCNKCHAKMSKMYQRKEETRGTRDFQQSGEGSAEEGKPSAGNDSCRE